MISFIVVAVAALGAAGLTMYSGFGLGTLLLPVFALFFPVEVAVAATAVVHLANNIFKIGLVGKLADRSLVLNFGLPAIFAAMLGAAALGYMARFEVLATYNLGPHTAEITPIKLLMGALIFFFALFELLPGLKEIKFDRRYLALGGFFSGFFGGLSGHQGALRSAFLVKTGVSTQAFVGTNAMIAFMVDLARIATYGGFFLLAGNGLGLGAEEWPLIITGIVAAFTGVMLGKRWLHKVKMSGIQTLTGMMLLAVALALAAGLV